MRGKLMVGTQDRRRVARAPGSQSETAGTLAGAGNGRARGGSWAFPGHRPGVGVSPGADRGSSGIGELEALKIGQLTMENDFLKKAV